MITLYIRPECTLCKQAKKVLTVLNIPFKEVVIDGDANVTDKKDIPTPIAKIGGLILDSYASLMAYVLKMTETLTKGENMTNVNRNDLVAKLNNGVVTVTFRKANGTTRVLKGTLNNALVDTAERKNLQTNGGLNPDVINCWDTEARGWRTFRLGSIISVA